MQNMPNQYPTFQTMSNDISWMNFMARGWFVMLPSYIALGFEAKLSYLKYIGKYNGKEGSGIYVRFKYYNMQGREDQLTILTNRVPMRSANICHMLIFEWLLLAYYFYLFCSVMIGDSPHQTRVLVYCLFFLLFDKLQLTYKYLQLQDPLHLSPIINCIRYVSYVCMFNLCILLVRITITNQNIHAFMIIMHYVMIMGLFLSEFSKKNSKLDINVDSNNIFSRFVTPLSLFIFNKTSQHHFSELWYLEFVMFAGNLFLTSELNRIILLKECQYLGWFSFEDKRKEKAIWNKHRALRSIIVFCLILIVIQNLLLMFQRVKYEISVTMIHSLLVAALSYYMYTGKNWLGS